VLDESLKQLQAEDLSAHLYNAHAMKRRLYDEELVSGTKGWMSKVCTSFQRSRNQEARG
jgi:hypothetical protein